MFNDAGAGMIRSTVTLMVLHILLGLEQPRTAAHKAVALIDCMLKQQIKTEEGRTAKAGFAVHVEALLSVSHFATEDRNSIVSYSLGSVASKSFSDRVELRMQSECVLSAGRSTSRKVKVVEMQKLFWCLAQDLKIQKKVGPFHVKPVCNHANGDIRARTARSVAYACNGYMLAQDAIYSHSRCADRPGY